MGGGVLGGSVGIRGSYNPRCSRASASWARRLAISRFRYAIYSISCDINEFFLYNYTT